MWVRSRSTSLTGLIWLVYQKLRCREERFEDYKDFLCSCLQVMVVGESQDLLLNQTVRTILYQTLNYFFKDADILSRYEAAERCGLDSPTWQQMPTLRRFFGDLSAFGSAKPF